MKVLLVDDHAMFRDGVCALLANEGIEVVGHAGDGHQAIACAKHLRPDIVLMDLAMPSLNGADATRRLATELPGVKVVGLGATTDRRMVMEMLKFGAVGYLPKSAASSELVAALQAVNAGLTYLSPAVAGTVVANAIRNAGASRTQPEKLTSREREVLQQVAEGRTSKEIATKLHLAVPTVETHRRQIMDRLNLRTVADLTKYAIREGLTSVDK